MTCVKHFLPRPVLQKGTGLTTPAESILTKPSSAFWRAGVTGNEEAIGEEEERAGERPPSPALVLLFLPHFSLFKSQECKSLKPPDLREGNQWRWCRDLKADPPCVSHRQWPHLLHYSTTTPHPLSLSVWRSPGSSLYSDRCYICAHSVCFYCVLKGWGAELCFTWSLNPSQIKPCVCVLFSTVVCFLKAIEWVTGTTAVRWAGFHWFACCRQPSLPPHFQYWPSCLLLSLVSRQCTLKSFITLEIIEILLPFCLPFKKEEGCGCKKRKLELCRGREVWSLPQGGSSDTVHHLNSPPHFSFIHPFVEAWDTCFPDFSFVYWLKHRIYLLRTEINKSKLLFLSLFTFFLKSSKNTINFILYQSFQCQNILNSWVPQLYFAQY